jgi:uncharacterized protein (TIGR03437 family)
MTVRQYSIGFLLAILSGAGAAAQSYNISDFAGNYSAGFSGDSGQATQAQLNFPGGVVVAPNGNVYIADPANNRVRMVTPGGTISTVAGNGTAGYTGDKGAATSAELDSPVGVGLDGSGNLYIADSANNVIRQVTPSGTITTWAGTNVLGYTGDGGPANVATLDDPVAITFDSSGNAYICDAGNNVVREVNTSLVIFSLVGGTATTDQLSQPNAVAPDTFGNLYVADTGNRRIIQFNLSNLTFNWFAGTELIGDGGDGGPALSATFDDPFGLAVDASGNVFIADTFNSRIRMISKATGIITTVAGTGFPGALGDGGPALDADFYFPHSVALDSSGNIYVGDTFNQVIRKMEAVAPQITSNGVVNAASYAEQVSPGALASIFGSNFAGAETVASLPLPTNLAGVSVTVNGKPAPLLAVTGGQINFQVPWEAAVGDAQIVVSVNGKESNTVTVPVVAAGPGIFSGGGQAVVQNSNGSLNASNNPAGPGTMITAYLTGSGPLSAELPDGTPAPTSPLIWSTSQVVASIGSTSASVQFAGLAPGFVGLVQMNIQVPSGMLSGNYPLTIRIDDQTSNAATITVAQ